jgi:hypothetical protein
MNNEEFVRSTRGRRPDVSIVLCDHSNLAMPRHPIVTHAAGMTTTSDPVTATEDRLAILELIGRLALLLDARDWDALAGVFTESVYSDRTSLFGGEPVTLPAVDFVAGWRQSLDGLDAVHHLIACHVIDLNGDEATCAANMQGVHVLTNALGRPDVDGRRPPRLPAQADP